MPNKASATITVDVVNMPITKALIRYIGLLHGRCKKRGVDLSDLKRRFEKDYERIIAKSDKQLQLARERSHKSKKALVLRP